MDVNTFDLANQIAFKLVPRLAAKPYLATNQTWLAGWLEEQLKIGLIGSEIDPPAEPKPMAELTGSGYKEEIA